MTTQKSGIITISYWVLIIDHSWLRDPAIKMFKIAFDTTAYYAVDEVYFKVAYTDSSTPPS